MSMTSLSVSDCLDILKDFKLRVPHVPVDLLTELAFNYGLDAPVDLDPMDIVSILSPSGTPRVFPAEIGDYRRVEAGFSEFMSRLCDQGVSFSMSAGCLLIVKSNHIDLPVYGRILSILSSHLHPQTHLGHALYSVGDASPKVSLKLILASTDSSNGVSVQPQSLSSTSISNEVPAFLLRGNGK